VSVELRLRNLLADIPIQIDARLAPEFGTVLVHIRRPDGRTVEYAPIVWHPGDLLLAAPPKLFPSKSFKPKSPIPVMPVLSPDNYMQVIPALLESATKSIVIEQYIRGAQPQIVKLLDAITRARSHHPKLEIRIVLAPSVPGQAFRQGSQRDPPVWGLTSGSSSEPTYAS
jgi:hypothetical protein